MNKVLSRSKLGEIEWIRSICCILVIIIHVTAEYWNSFTVGSLQYKFNILLNGISQFAVPCFVFISGFVLYYVYHNREYKILDFYKKRIPKLVFPYLIWSFVYIFVRHAYYSSPISLINVVKDLLVGRASGHLYYMILIIQFYLVFPLLLKAYEKIDNKILSMGIFTIGNIIIMEFVKMPFKDRFFMNYLIFFGLGFLLADLKIEGFEFNKILKIGIMSVYLIFSIYYLTDRYRAMAGLPLMWNGLYRYAWWIFSLISIISIYLLSSILNDIKHSLVNNRMITSLSNHSFTIYLSHMLFITILRNLKLFNQLKDYSMTISFVFQLVIIIGVTWITSIALERLKNIMNQPTLNKGNA